MSIILGFAFTLRLLKVDVLVNIILMYWIYLYTFSYCPFHAHTPTQTFRPFLANGLNEQASPIAIF
jgi:hypothetical protein